MATLAEVLCQGDMGMPLARLTLALRPGPILPPDARPPAR